MDRSEDEKLRGCLSSDLAGHDVGDHVSRYGPQFCDGARGASPMAVERPDGVRLPTEAKGRTLAGGDDGDWRGVLEEVGQEGPTMVCQEVNGHGVGGMEDAEPAHNSLHVRRLVMLV